MLNVGFNINSPQYKNTRMTFGYNNGVIKAIDALKQDVNSGNIEELQAQLQDMDFTDTSFIGKIKKLSEHWQKVMVKYAPDNHKISLKNIFGIK